MATIYSLICWGGRSGLTATMTIASPCVVTINNHGLRAGKGVIFSTTGALPTGVTAGTTYYVGNLATSTFNLYDTEANAITGGATGRVNTSGTQSGTHTATGAYWSGLTADQKARYGTAGSERAYASMSAWNTGRAGASGLDVEYCEIGEAFTDIAAGNVIITVPAGATFIESKVNGVRTAAYHQGVVSSSTNEVGYLIRQTAGTATCLNLNTNNAQVDGISARVAVTQGNAFVLSRLNCKAINCIAVGNTSSAVSGIGVANSAVNTWSVNNIAIGFSVGFNPVGFNDGITVANCLATKCTTGFPTVASLQAYYYNNISVGNTTNWGSSTPTVASNNAGLSGEAWVTGSNPRYTIATTDFVDHTNNDFHPAAITSPQVEQAAQFFGAYAFDNKDTFRPAYPGSAYNTAVTAGSFVAGLSYTIATVGTTDFTLIGASANTVGVTFKATGVGSGTGTATLNAKYDIGPFEFDLGYGAWPSTQTRGLAFTGLVAGSLIKVFDTGTDNERFSTTNSGTSETWSESTAGSVTVDYVIMKAGYEPLRVTNVTVTASDAGENGVSVTQVPARWYQASSGLTINTNAYANASTKKFGLTTTSTVQNFASYMLEQWIALGDEGEAYANKAFPITANGPNSFTFGDGWQFDLTTYPNSITNLSRDGLRYLNSSGAVTAIWAAILTVGVSSGMRVRYQQSDGGTTVSAAVTSGNMDQLVQVLSDPNGDGSFGDGYDRRGYLVLKVQEQGYDQGEANVIATYGNLEDQLYVVGLVPTPNGVATGDPGITGVTITDHAGSPVTWNGGSVSITITDSAANSGTDILRWLRYNFETGGTFEGKDGFNWHDLVQTNGAKFKTVRGAIYGDTGATLKGVRVLRGSDPHPDFDLFTFDDGTTYSPPVVASISITGLVNAGAVPTRLQIINKTAESAAAWQATTAYSLGAMRRRTTGLGSENTAGLYFRATTAGTSGGTEPTWNTTVGGTTTDGTVVWTTYAVLFYHDDPAATSYSATYTEGNQFKSGETVEVRFSEMNGSTSFKRAHATTLASSSGFSFALTTEADDVFAANALDGSSYESTFSPNYVSDYIVLDTNTDFSGKAAYAYFCYLLTTDEGMYNFWDGVTALDAGNYRIETDILNLYFDESAGFVKQTDDVRIFRKDGTRPALDPTTGGNGIEINWRVPVSVVTTGGSALTPAESAHLLGLTNAPSAATVAAQVLTSAQSAPIYADIRKVNDLTVNGSGTEIDPWGP